LLERLAALSAQITHSSTDRAAQESLLRTEVGTRLENMNENQNRRLTDIANGYSLQQDKLNTTVSTALRELREENTKKLDEMRKTVDEKLEATLGTRLGESFKIVTEQLERLYESFGKMQELGEGVNSLTRVLTNVKTRGTWGEVQLKSILEQILAPSQYEENAHPIPRSGLVVEFAVKMPGRGEGEFVYLPVDSKFPQEDYLRIVDASERADKAALEIAQAALYTRILA
jgi:DNA recombination protein RmuC